MKVYKYKREHFETHEQFDRYRKRQTIAQNRWLKKLEKLNPEHRERRILTQRLYSRYHYHTECRQSFTDWLKEIFNIDDIKSVTIERLRVIARRKKEL